MEKRIIAQILLGVILLILFIPTFLVSRSDPYFLLYVLSLIPITPNPFKQYQLYQAYTIPIVLFIAGTALIISGIMKYRDISQK